MASSTSPSLRPRLSVAMIVCDEQNVLAESIRSVQPVADEIVVLDTGSTDQTAVVAEQEGARVCRADWTDDFSAARNSCLEHVSGDWVLWLNAGERLAAESCTALREFVDGEAKPGKVYRLVLELPSADRTASDEQVLRPRLAPWNPQLQFEGRLCETMDRSMEAAGLEFDTAPGKILLHSRRNEPQFKAQRAERDLKLIALQTADTDDAQPRLLIAKGEAYADLNDQNQARRAFLQAVAASPRGSIEMLESYYGLLTTYDGDQSQKVQQLTVCLEALEIFPLDAQLLCAMGNCLQGQNKVELAVRAFETAVKYGQVNMEVWHLCELAEVAAVCLNLTLQLAGKDEEARRVMEEALDRCRNSVRVRRHLIDLHVKHGRDVEALQVAEKLPITSESRRPLEDAVRGAAKAAVADWEPALGYLQSAYVAGCRDPICLRWLSITLLCNGQIEAAAPVLREWCELEPANVEAQTYLRALTQQADDSQPAADSTDSRRIRIDPGTTVAEVGPPFMPIIGQVSTTDMITDPNP